MSEIGRFLILCGFGIVVIGLLVPGLGRIGFRGLPGDIACRSDYFQIVTCLVISLILTLASWLYHGIARK